MDELKKEIGKRIKQCRKEKGMTQKELAKEVGCHEGTIRQYENGLRSPRLVSQYAIAKALSVPHESLFTLSAPCAQLSTNLAEVGTDVPDNNVGELISREQAIEVLERAKQNIHHNIERAIGDAVCEVLDAVENGIKQLPPIQPVIVPCDYAKACNEATMNELTSAVAYYDVLEELRKHGYVLVDMREVNNESN